MLLSFYSVAQPNPYWQEPSGIQVDSLKKVLNASQNDTLNMYINRQLGLYYQEINRPVALKYLKNLLNLAKKTNQKIWEAEALSRIGYVSCLMQNYAGGLESILLAKTLASQKGIEKGMWNPGTLSVKSDPFVVRMTILADLNQHLGLLYYFTGEFSKALEYSLKVREITKIVDDEALMSLNYLNMGEAYLGLGKLDSAEWSFNKAILYSDKSGHKKYKGLMNYDIGRIYEIRNNYEEAKKYYALSIEINKEVESPDFEGMGYQALANLAGINGNIDSVFYFSRKALKKYVTINDTLGLIAAYSSLSSAYDALQQTDSAHHYLKKSIVLKNALNKADRVNSFQLTGFNEQFKLQELEANQLRTKTKIRTYSFIAGATVLLLISGIFYRDYRRQRKDKTIIEKAYVDLKATQSQLIQSEKMASLGELTAGIAHEIQNPLNFINNFAEINRELIDEIQEERRRDKGERNDRLESELINSVKENEEKINHHGKRADAIVKGMLQHSSSSSGQKEPADINALADEYFRLAYHGLRAKDKSFNATMKTNFDETIGNVNVIPQDMGRVILNLIINAFYAVNEKKKQSLDNYDPTVSVSTKRKGDKVLISVKDNGNGISDSIKEKIFQPFFTTKPPGQGTGLGLSMVYDMVTKGHGGTLEVESTEGKGTEFTIHIPC